MGQAPCWRVDTKWRLACLRGGPGAEGRGLGQGLGLGLGLGLGQGLGPGRGPGLDLGLGLGPGCTLVSVCALHSKNISCT